MQSFSNFQPYGFLFPSPTFLLIPVLDLSILIRVMFSFHSYALALCLILFQNNKGPPEKSFLSSKLEAATNENGGSCADNWRDRVCPAVQGSARSFLTTSVKQLLPISQIEKLQL